MTAILIIAGIVAAISLYDFFTTRNWQQVTSAARNETVFENRNKNYGAFKIRRDYNRNFILILLGMVGGVGVIYAAATTFKSPVEKEKKQTAIEQEMIEMKFDEKDEVEKEPEVELPKKEELAKLPEMTKFTPPKVVDEPDPTLPDPPVDPIGPVGPKEIKDPGGDPFAIPPGGGKDPKGGGNGTEQTKSEPETVVDEPAEFPGGRAALKAFLEDNLRYPEWEAQQGIGGKCYLRFVVSKTGEISRVSVIRKVAECPDCDKEAQRVVKKMPNWKPGRQNGQAVAVYFNLPIRFTLNPQ